ncbi:hypothetical protein [Candidatus Nephthysia bennettiae]|uniref:Uncharacterized protein n=1 Tax=Candidatus Nephthysia bennettiae TaxID=3127016 RepID=A0A934K6I2_9BACT|nr:hypothetical protein [Candidatus Dormibacteraeota bacterium]MBJ7613912.1 hypothetical protein [Candidatus Dormibacteraeota bacterium]
MRYPWRLFWIALGSTALLALGFGIGVSSLGASRQPAPQLSALPSGALAGAGITLAAPQQPPYCETERALAQQGWVSSSFAGCPIAETAASASAAALPGGQGTVDEAVLAEVTGSAGGVIGQNRVAWVMVVHSKYLVLPATGCAPPRPNGPACAARGLGHVSTEVVVVVDGSSGQVLATVPVPTQGR